MKEPSPIFIIQTNINEYAPAWVNCKTPESKIAFAEGYFLGMQGGYTEETDPFAMQEGCRIAARARARALDYQEAKRKAGAKGGKVTELKRLQQLKQG